MLQSSKSIQRIQRILAESHTLHGRIRISRQQGQGYHGGISNNHNGKSYFLAPSSNSPTSSSSKSSESSTARREHVSIAKFDNDCKYYWSSDEKTRSRRNSRYFHSSQAIFQSNHENDMQINHQSTSKDHDDHSSQQQIDATNPISSIPSTSNGNASEHYRGEYHKDHSYTHESSPVDHSDNYNQNLSDYYQHRNHPQSQRNALINFTHEIMSNTPIGSMTKQQIEDTRSLIYKWFGTLVQPKTTKTSSTTSNKNNNTNHNSIPHQKAIDTALIMETLLERLIEEYDEGLNENAIGVVRVKEYNVVMNAYAKCVSNYFNDKNLNWKHKLELDVNNIENVHDHHDRRGRNIGTKIDDNDIDSRNDNGDNIDVKYHDQQHGRTSTNESDFYTTTTDSQEDYIAITKAEELVQRMKSRFENYANLFPDEIDKITDTNKNNFNEFDDRIPPKPDALTYNSLLSVYSNQYNNEKAVENAEKIIKLLESPDESVQADTITYNTLINIYANQIGEYGYAQKAEDVLLNMSKLRKEGSELVKPNTMSFNIVLKAWRNSGGGTVECKFLSAY